MGVEGGARIVGSMVGRAGFALDEGFEFFYFFGQQVAEFAGMNVEGKRTVADAFQFLNVVAGLFEHFAHLAVAAFDEGDFVPGVFGFVDELDASGCGTSLDAFAVWQRNP